MIYHPDCPHHLNWFGLYLLTEIFLISLVIGFIYSANLRKTEYLPNKIEVYGAWICGLLLVIFNIYLYFNF